MCPQCHYNCFSRIKGLDLKQGVLVCSVVILALNGGDQWSDFRIRPWSVCGSVALIALKRGNYSPGNTSTQNWFYYLSERVCECVFLHPGSFSQTFHQRDRVSHKDSHLSCLSSSFVFLFFFKRGLSTNSMINLSRLKHALSSFSFALLVFVWRCVFLT